LLQVVLLAAQLSAAAPPVLIQSAPGRFEIAAVDPTIAHGVATAAEEAWRIFSAPLSLPDAFPSPIFVRILPPGEMASERAPFYVTVEVGGIVSVRLRADAATLTMTRRALVQSLLMRLAVARHGLVERLNVPLWLEHGSVGWWETRVSASQLDAVKQRAAAEAAPTMEALLGWQRGGEEKQSHASAAMWLFTFLQSESGRAREWPALLPRLLNGDDALIAMVESYPGRYRSAEDRELWWQTGYHHLCRTRTLPSLDAVDSRHQLGGLARFVFAGANDESDLVVPLAEAVSRTKEPVVAAEIARRTAELSKLIPSLHPFYRNAGLSLSAAFAAPAAKAPKVDAACAAFDQDWRDAVELESASRSALDRLEGGKRGDARP
jgi:hypothetical protein